MPILLAIRTPDEIICAADGSRSETLAGAAGRGEIQKFTSFAPGIALGILGASGTSHRVRREIERIWVSGAFDDERDINRVIGHLQAAVRSQLLPDLAAADTARSLLGAEAERPAAHEVLVTFPIHDQCHLFHFDAMGCCSEGSTATPFFAIGPVRRHAESFAFFVQRLLWKGGLPTREEALLTAAWCLHHCYRSLPESVHPPYQFLVVHAHPELGWATEEVNPEPRVQEAMELEAFFREKKA